MNLFTHRHQYQRSIDNVFKDLAYHSQEKPDFSSEKSLSNNRSSINLDNLRNKNDHTRFQNAITPQVESENFLIQNDTKAWGNFLDSKRNG